MTYMIEKAHAIARIAHEGQLYDGKSYYENHVLKVHARVAHLDEDTQCIALLHDVVEDSDVTLQDLFNAGFSPAVVYGVATMTHAPDKGYMEYLMDFVSTMAIEVKYADMSENLSNNPSAKNRMKYEMGMAYFRRYHHQTLFNAGLL